MMGVAPSNAKFVRVWLYSSVGGTSEGYWDDVTLSNVFLGVAISGPVHVYHPEKSYPPNPYTWQASASGGTGPYKFYWFKGQVGQVASLVDSGASHQESFAFDGFSGSTSQFYFRVEAWDNSSPSQFGSNTLTVTEHHSGGGIEPKAVEDYFDEFGGIPERFIVQNAFPNPFNPTTNVRFGIPKSGLVTLRIYDMLGRIVHSQERVPMTEGFHTFRWGGRDEDGDVLPSGIYLAEIIAQLDDGSNGRAATKLMLAR